MTDDGTSRFVVRKGAVKNTWMVWDRKPTNRRKSFTV
jgi:hypothetical protein